MIELIDDMLDISRIRNKRLSIRPRPTELSQVVQRAAAQLSAQTAASKSSIIVRAAQPVHGHWDEFRIEQVVASLLSNALRHGEGKPVEISISSVPTGACITVSDQGQGIAAHDQERIFEQFERGATHVNGNASPGGFGLGLYISRQLVEAHGGTLQVQSHPGQGAVFTVTLPLQAPAQAAS